MSFGAKLLVSMGTRTFRAAPAEDGDREGPAARERDEESEKARRRQGPDRYGSERRADGRADE
jgi:hypothetical protein